jgi:hypothetical protein
MRPTTWYVILQFDGACQVLYFVPYVAPREFVGGKCYRGIGDDLAIVSADADALFNHVYPGATVCGTY